jgi:hypothetical protein
MNMYKHILKIIKYIKIIIFITVSFIIIYPNFLISQY